MRKTEHLQFLVLMIPTFVILLAAAVSMTERVTPVDPAYVIATASQR